MAQFNFEVITFLIFGGNLARMRNAALCSYYFVNSGFWFGQTALIDP
jgi:hypothetical protein